MRHCRIRFGNCYNYRIVLGAISRLAALQDTFWQLLQLQNTLAEARDHNVTGCFGNKHTPALFIIIFSFFKSEDSDEGVEWQETGSESSAEHLGLQYLYIQMEYCEMSTLRNLIDEGLHKDKERIWRLFREIVEGLVHIHTQVMRKY